MKDQIEIGLRELRASIKRMKELLEWQKLQKQEERGRRTPPSFRFQDRFEADIKIEEGVFWKTVFEIQDVLGERDDEAAKKTRERVAKLEGEMRELARVEG
jgi:DNA-binding transcriptional MerR regulator